MNNITIKIKSAGYLDDPEVIKDIQFTLRQGELVGLIGANGAGKSTTMRAMMGLLPKFEGTVSLDDIRYAYIPEHPIFYDELTLWEHLEFATAAFHLEKWEARANTLLTRFQLDHVKHDLPTGFSKGMRQKVMLVLAFLLKPELYIIDEPFIGLDPRSTKELLNMILEEKERGAAIFMSTHVLDTAEKICDRILLVSGGTLIAQGTLAHLRERSQLPNGSLLDCFDRLLEAVES
ncbi:ABC transporter ATP-binding protein [Pueribacillus sp. YX66]|uniref:ABC transporter ATP-binding protein n=1 Tax=Pueribacillus sp. YX66 TaxID=3229242 RepID=UPI00358D4D1D